MPHEVSATKFRPQTFDELVGQEFVASTLKNSINNHKIANAYLLSGPRGVGKTSAARIIAKALNCDDGPTGTPCNKCDNCLSITKGYNNDVIEIDGASNTSINDIRVIQEEILYPPVTGKYKTYIIDEVHMLSKSAFNALLKTIEEPPDKVVFIFATTEINKVLPTIRSRCQQFNFRLIPTNLLVESLTKVLDAYEYKYEEDAVRWVAEEGKGSMRDSYTLLDQVCSFCQNDISLKRIQEKLGLVGEEKMSRLITGILDNNRELIFTEYFSMLESGISPEQIITEMIKFFRNMLILKSNIRNQNVIGFNPKFYDQNLIDAFTFEDIENILEILFNTYERSKFSIDLQTEIEVCLLKLLKFKELIRPKQIINQLYLLKKALVQNIDIKEFEDRIAETIPNRQDRPQQQIQRPPQQQPSAPPSQPKPTTAPPVNKPAPQQRVQERPSTPSPPAAHRQQQPINNDNEITMPPGKSEILKIVKSKIQATHFQLATALTHVTHIEEKDNQMFLYYSHKMHYDIAKDNEELLTKEAIAIIGEDYNRDFKIRIKYKEVEKKLTVTEINKENIKQVFEGKEI